MTEEEVAVLVVLVDIDREIGCLSTAFGIHGLRLRVLLRHKSRSCKFSELQFRFYTEKGC